MSNENQPTNPDPWPGNEAGKKVAALMSEYRAAAKTAKAKANAALEEAFPKGERIIIKAVGHSRAFGKIAGAWLAHGAPRIRIEDETTGKPLFFDPRTAYVEFIDVPASDDEEPTACGDCGRTADEGAEGIETRYDGEPWCAGCWAEEVRINERQADEDFRTDWQR